VSSNAITWVGLDAHKKSIHVAMLVPGREEPLCWQEANEETAVRRLARRLTREAPGEVRACYEAGPLGYALQREFEAQQVICEVVAPSLIPIKPGERIKTDWRDARKLAELLRAGMLTAVQPPNEADEALRDLCRGRDSVRQDLMRARHRMSKFLLRRGYRYRETQRHWGVRHMKWLRPLAFEHASAQAIFDHYLLTIDHLEERQRQVDAHLEVFGGLEPYRQPVAWLRCFRGIDTVTAVSLVAELHDFRRFRSGACVDGVSGTGAQRTLQWRATPSGLHHARRQSPRSTSVGRGRLASPPSAGAEPAAEQASRRTARAHHRHCGSCAGATSRTLRAHDSARYPLQQGRRRHGSGARGLPVGDALYA
jgi:transposase